MQTKRLHSYIQFFTRVTVNHPKDKRLFTIGTAEYFIHESAIDSVTVQMCNVLGKKGQDDGSIHLFKTKQWASKGLKSGLKYPDGVIEEAQIDRIFTLRSKLIAHVDRNMDFLVSFDDILNFMYVFDKYIKASVELIYGEFLNGQLTHNLYRADFSDEAYNVLFRVS
jgi:hypothetical protein